MAQLYAKGEYRVPGDIDIWLEGDRKTIMNWVSDYSLKNAPVYHNVPICPIGGTEIEVHFTPSWMNCYFTNRTLQNFFRQYSKKIFCNEEHLVISEDGNSCYKQLPVPPLEFNRVFILVHIYRHLFGEGIGLRQLMDYYHVLCQGFTAEERVETLNVLRSLMHRCARAMSCCGWERRRVSWR